MLHRDKRSTDQNPPDRKGKRVLVLVGPTASGKTAVSIPLAKLLKGEIISADSRQIYKHLDIGTAKPIPEQRSVVRHHFVDELYPDQEFNAGEFGALGRKRIAEIFRRGKTPIVVGGSGLYIRSLIDGLFEGPGADKEFRGIMESRLRTGGAESLLVELKRVDPVTAAHADPSKPRRIIRALEVYHLTGRPVSELFRKHAVEINFTPIIFGLWWDRQLLYERIDRRCDQMVADGLLDEVEALDKQGYDSSINALNTVGYAEAFAYRRGKISYIDFLRLLKQNSRRYAKRQLTWFKRDSRIHWIRMDVDSRPEQIGELIADRFVAAGMTGGHS